MGIKFDEEKLEKAIMELFELADYTYIKGEDLTREKEEVLIKYDLIDFIFDRYEHEEITYSEVEGIIKVLENLPSSTVYDSNKKIINMISEGFTIRREDSSKKDLFIQLIDFEDVENNIFKIVNQMEIKQYHERIPDAIVYVNGLPLVVFEFKSAIRENASIYDAYKQLTVRYRRDIPELFKYNALCVISDGANNKMGSFFAPYEFFYSWRKVEGNEKLEKDGIDSLFTMVNGLFNKKRLIDVIHNFIYFPDTSTKDEKIVPRYPQYYAANKLLNSIKKNMKPHGNGKGGTYFGATGCGKSFTMLYLTRLLMRDIKLDSPTIILITDRTDLDDQLSKIFVKARAFIGDNGIVSVGSRQELREKLKNRKSGGVFLTTIQKFSEDIEILTDRNNVICISDEAHRSQINLDQKVKATKEGVKKKYGFAKYLHKSLPNATYVGFTGTPIDETMVVFGEIEDSYTMIEAVYDEITVRIVYEGRAAKVTLDENELKKIEDYYEQCAEMGANENQIEESKKTVVKMDSILGHPDRLKLVAKDFVEHYEKRVEEGASIIGKAMFVASNREIAYNLYKEIIALRPEWAEIKECEEGRVLSEKEKKSIKPIEKIKMIMTRDKAKDIKELYELLGTKEERKELDRQYKKAKSNFKIAIVVDMWLTGFDVPELDTIYIDKPIQQHSLIQTISRVNRVHEGKEKGLVVDYIGIKSKMNLALKKYGQVSDNNFEGIEEAIVIVKDQLDLLAKLFYGFNTNGYFNGTPLEQLQCLNKAVEFVQQTKELEKRFMTISKKLNSAYRLCCTCEEITSEEKDKVHFYLAIKSILHKLTKGDAPDAAQMNEKVRGMINEAIISEGVEEVFKLDKNDSQENDDIFSDEYLAKVNKIKLPNTRIKLLQKLLSKAISEFKRVNKVRGTDFSKRMKVLVDLYNERKDFESMKSDVLDDLAEKLADLFKDLVNEKNSSNDLGISFEEKAFYDILKSVAEKHGFEYPHNKLINLSKKIKKVVDDKSKYTDWNTRDDIKAEFKVAIILTLDVNGYPPEPSDEIFKEIFEQAENFKKYSMV